jgi:hypothetical protein
MAKNSILGLGPKKLANLLGITFDSEKEDKPDSKETIAQMLEARLASPLLPDTTMLQSVRSETSQRDEDVELYSGVPLGDVLTASNSDFAIVKEIRRYAKRMTRGKDSQAEHVAVTIYFAAIANALLFHQAKITSYSYESLEISFNKLIKKSWMPQGLRQLFVDAAEACRNKTQERGAR